MAVDVKFLQGTQENYEALGEYDSKAFYYTGTNLYLGTMCLSEAGEVQEALAEIAKNKEAIEALQDVIGDLESLDTTAKDTIVNAINEIYDSILAAAEAAKVTIESNDEDSDYSKTYTISQGGTTIGVINIPKDLVVKSGSVETDPDGQEPGTYIVLVLADEDETKLYINVTDLFEAYTAAPDAAQVQIAINGTEISASLVAGAVTATELADDAVTTSKIADGAITTDKLSTTLQEVIENGGGGIKEITTGTTNGTIAVDGTEVAVAGLQSAAYATIGEFDAAGAADTALEEAKIYTDTALTWTDF